MKKVFFVLAACIISSQLKAQRPDSVVVVLDEFPSSNIELVRVVVTATKSPRKQSETGKVMTVISRQQLEKSSGKSIGEVLNTTVGTTIIGANNNAGTNLTTSIRGASAGNVLILIDGIPVNDPSVITNYYDLNLISIDQVERIEIVKGGQSTLYGSDAVAGVINIILKKGSTKPSAFTASLSGGSYDSFNGNIGLSRTTKRSTSSLYYTYHRANGFSAAYDSTGNKNFDKDGLDQHTLNGRINIAMNKRIQVYLSGLYSYYKTDLDASAYTDEKDYTVTNNNAQAAVGLSFNHKNGLLRFNYHFNYVSRIYLDDSSYKSSPFVDYSDNRFIGRTHFAEIYNSQKWEQVELLTGLDYRFNNTHQYSFYVFPGFPSPPSLLDAKMSQLSPYVSVIIKNNEGLNIEVGGRLNHHSAYGNNFSFTFNPSYRLSSKARFFANLYSAYKTPTLYQLFDAYAGNPKLEPEKGIIAEAGADIYANTRGWFRVVGFYRNTKKSIQYITVDPVNYISKYQNISRQENYGVETEASFKTGKWDFALNYTYTDGKTRSGYDGTGSSLGKDTTYYNLYRIPKHALNFSIGWYATKNLFLNTQLHVAGKREEFVYGSVPTTQDGYATIGLYGEYEFSKKIKMFIDMKNITDSRYFDIPGYNSSRFNFMAGISFSL